MANLFDKVRASSQISAFSPGREVPADIGNFQDAIGDIEGSFAHLQRDKNVDIRKKSGRDAQKYSSKFPEISIETLATEIATLRLLKAIAERVQGHFHLPTNPTQSFSVDRTVANAQRLIYLSRKVGLDKSRVVIRIVSTVEGFQACKQLSKLGIQTSAVAPAVLEQVARAVEAGCSFVAPPCSDFYDINRQYDLRLAAAACEYVNKFASNCSILPEGPFHFGTALALAGMRNIALDPLAMSELKQITAWDPNWQYFGYFAQMKFPGLEKLSFEDDSDYQSKLLNVRDDGVAVVELSTHSVSALTRPFFRSITA
ncbi:MAG: hypothetical protein Q9165_001062 [Trypethelium subeluteriae]